MMYLVYDIGNLLFPKNIEQNPPKFMTAKSLTLKSAVDLPQNSVEAKLGR